MHSGQRSLSALEKPPPEPPQPVLWKPPRDNCSLGLPRVFDSGKSKPVYLTRPIQRPVPFRGPEPRQLFPKRLPTLQPVLRAAGIDSRHAIANSNEIEILEKAMDARYYAVFNPTPEVVL